ncbi:hypothetical protein [Methylobacterium sp. AMS5]|uniref:hypothetical protein n=1 Tax=Methylobacterium sp. AMS5 TaxID=925818 RepID=UPI00074F957B|nr:hypothetical protein [Methylobacterium sp. AMS5]AMB48292.1 hypothetical protein Y590_25325 [Methylobacterium sp. AMS5]
MSGFRKQNFCDLLDPFQEEFNRFMLGELLGSGESRVVYAQPDGKNLVFKVEAGWNKGEFHNVREWNLWKELEDYPDARAWLAPCRAISEGGKILAQARVRPLKGIEELKGIKIPDFLGDCHWGNLGHYKGRIVCHDYAYNRVSEKAARSFRLIKNRREDG